MIPQIMKVNKVYTQWVDYEGAYVPSPTSVVYSVTLKSPNYNFDYLL